MAFHGPHLPHFPITSQTEPVSPAQFDSGMGPWVFAGYRNGSLFTQSFTATLGFTGSLAKLTLRALTAVLSFSGLWTAAFVTPVSEAGTLSFAGSLLLSIANPLTGTLSFVGSLAKLTLRALTAVLSFSGLWTAAFVTTVSKAGTLSFVGSLHLSIANPLTGTLSFVGSLPKLMTRVLAGTLSFAGSLPRLTSRAIAGTLSFAGALPRLAALAQAGTLSFVGSVVRMKGIVLSGTLSFAGATLRVVAHGLTATLSFSGAMARSIVRAISGTLSFSGSMTSSHVTIANLAGTLLCVGAAIGRLPTKGLTASLGLAGAIGRFVSKLIGSLLNFAGTLVGIPPTTVKFCRYGRLYCVPRYPSKVQIRVARSLDSGNDYLVMLLGMRDGVTGAYVTNANLTFTALANWTGISGTPISGATALPLNLIQGSNGNYVGAIRGNVSLTPSMNPVAIQVQGANYNLIQRIIHQVS
ncbi:MAG: hypothetical protein ACREQ5_03430 [Candidatus Dormibacteria bacterium]